MGTRRITYRQHDDHRTATVTVDGVDVSRQLAGLRLEHAAGKPPAVQLALRPGEAPDVLADAEVVVVSEGPTPLEFLAPIDPGELDRCVLAAMELGGPQTYGHAALEVLRAWAAGE